MPAAARSPRHLSVFQSADANFDAVASKPRIESNRPPLTPDQPTNQNQPPQQRASGGSVATDDRPAADKDQDREGLDLEPGSGEKEPQSPEALTERSEGPAAAAAAAARSGSGAVGGGDGGSGGGEEGGVRGEEEDEGWEMVADPEVPETCCGFARLQEEGVS